MTSLYLNITNIFHKYDEVPLISQCVSVHLTKLDHTKLGDIHYCDGNFIVIHFAGNQQKLPN